METKRVLNTLAAQSQEHRLAIFRLLVEYAPEGLSAGVIAERLSLGDCRVTLITKVFGTRTFVASMA